MPNVFKFTNWVTMETLRLLLNKLEVAQFFNTDYNKELTKEYPIGETFQVKLPQRFLPRTGMTYTPQDINRLTTPITCDQVVGVDFQWDSLEQALYLERGEEEISKQYLEPAANQLKQEIDSYCAAYAYQHANNIVGVLGTNPTTTAFVMQARQRMIELSGWQGKKGMLIAPEVNTALSTVIQALFQPADDVSKMFKEGSLGRLHGFDWYESMSLYSHTAGTWAIPGNVTVAAVPADGATSITINAGNGDTFNVGDVVSFALTYAVNPSTRRTTTTATLKQFVVTQALTAAGGGADVLNVYPAFYGPGSQYQNVNAMPQIGALLTLFPGTANPNGLVGKQGLALTDQAFALVSVKFQNPKAVEIASQTRDPKTGISVAFVRQFEGRTRTMINRFDVCFGCGPLYADNGAVRVLGAA